MKTKRHYHSIIRKRLALYQKECLACLRSGWKSKDAWNDKKRTLWLINKLLAGIPETAWSGVIRHNHWKLRLFYEDQMYYHDLWYYGDLFADLIYDRDDRTALVRMNYKGEFVDYDIRGS